jgi:hypothetical protein
MFEDVLVMSFRVSQEVPTFQHPPRVNFQLHFQPKPEAMRTFIVIFVLGLVKLVSWHQNQIKFSTISPSPNPSKQSLATAANKSCREVVFMKPHPIDCCTYPALLENNGLREKCGTDCKNKHDTNEHCTRVCELVEYEIYVDGKIKLDKVKNLFVNGKPENGEGEVKQESGHLDEAWDKIFEESLKTCEKDKDVKDGDDVTEQKISDLVLGYVNCIRRHNFVACPHMVASKECDVLKEAITTCSKTSEYFLFGVFFEKRKKDQLEGGTMGAIGKGR